MPKKVGTRVLVWFRALPVLTIPVDGPVTTTSLTPVPNMTDRFHPSGASNPRCSAKQCRTVSAANCEPPGYRTSRTSILKPRGPEEAVLDGLRISQSATSASPKRCDPRLGSHRYESCFEVRFLTGASLPSSRCWAASMIVSASSRNQSPFAASKPRPSRIAT